MANSPNDMDRRLYLARACLLGARARLAMFRRLGCLNSNDRDLLAHAEDDFLCALDNAWEAQTAIARTSAERVA